MKKQAESTSAEYDRLAEEHQKLQVLWQQLSNKQCAHCWARLNSCACSLKCIDIFLLAEPGEGDGGGVGEQEGPIDLVWPTECRSICCHCSPRVTLSHVATPTFGPTITIMISIIHDYLISNVSSVWVGYIPVLAWRGLLAHRSLAVLSGCVVFCGVVWPSSSTLR